MPIALNPTENVYVVATAADLPDELSRFVLYNLLYDPGAGVGMYYTSDGTNLLRLDTPAGAETDPVFTASAASGILAGDITNWNTAFGWGDHSTEGYAVKSAAETITGAWTFQAWADFHVGLNVRGGYMQMQSFTGESAFTAFYQGNDDYPADQRWQAFEQEDSTHGRILCIADNGSNARNVLRWTRNLYNITGIEYGNSTNNPVHTMYGNLNVNGGGLVGLLNTTSDVWGLRVRSTNLEPTVNDSGFWSISNNWTMRLRDSAGTVGVNLQPHTTSTFAFGLQVAGASITAAKIGQWDTAFGWGNHASAGYQAALDDPIYDRSGGTQVADLDVIDADGEDGLYHWTATQPTGSPGWTYGAVLAHYDGAQMIQLAFGGSSKGNLAVRRRDSGVWYAWTDFWSTDDFTQTNVNNWNSAIQNVVEDTTPELGGDLSTGAHDITWGGGDITVASGLTFDILYDASLAMRVQSSGIQFSQNVQVNNKNFDIQGATPLSRYVRFAHDDTDLNITGVGTTDINISGITAINMSGDIVFPSVGGIKASEATGNTLLDLDALPGDGTSNGTIRVHRETTTTGLAQLIVYRGDGSTSQCFHLTYDNTANSGECSVRGGTDLWVRDGADFIISDSSDADTATFNHDGVDFNLTFAGTTDWNITGLSALNVVNYTFNVNQTVGAGQNGYVLTYNNSSGEIELQAPTGGSTPVTKYKTAIESVTTSTTLQDDNHLTGWSLEAGAVYKITAHLHTTQSDAAGDPKLNWTFTNAPQDESYHYDSSNGGADFSTGGDTTLGRTVTTEVGTTMTGYFQANATTGGTLKLRWAQAASAGITSILPGSWVTIEKIS